MRLRPNQFFVELKDKSAMSIIGTIYEDVTPDVLGNIGIWQWLVVLASTAFTAASMVNQYEDMFLLKPPIEVTCISPEQDVLNASLCTVTSTNNATEELECKKWHVKLFWFIWLKKSWLVFCEDEMKLLSSTMISRMGLMFGCVIFGLIADSYGRRTAVAVDLFAQLGLGVFITFCDSEAWFQLLVFLKALFGAATLYLGLVTTCEISSNGWRSRLSAIVTIPRFLSSMCSVPLANAFPNMETYNFTTTFFVILLIILLRWTPESPQWLLFNRKIPDAEKCLYKAAKRNAINICDDFKIRPVNHRAYSCLDETRICTGIFYSYNVKIIIATSFLFWSLTSFKLGYLRAKVFRQHKTEQYLSVLITSAVGIAGLTITLSRKMLLRYLLLSNILLSVITANGEVLLGHFQIAPHIFTAVALGSEVVVHLLLLNITPRLFAINIRATLFGCCHAIGQLGTMISYLLFVFQPLDDIAAIGLDIGLKMVLVCLCLVLIDVDERELPDTIVDMDYFSELSKPLRWASQKTDSPSHEEVEMRIHSFGSARREMSQNRSEDRIPARRIGCFKFWRRFVANLRNTLSKS